MKVTLMYAIKNQWKKKSADIVKTLFKTARSSYLMLD